MKCHTMIEKLDLGGSTIVDGPEVPEDRDPAQREAEVPRSSMDYSEFDFSPPKQNRSSSVATT